MNYTKTLREFCLQNKGKIFDAQYELETRFSLVPYKTLLKILNRLEAEDVVTKISRGVYLINGGGADIDSAIMEYYVEHFSGMLIDTAMYNYYDISDDYAEVVEIYTNRITSNHKTIGKYLLTKFNIRFYDEVKGLITTLELIQKVNSIKEIDYIRYNEEREFGLSCYSDTIFKEIVLNHRYKYATIATLDILLNKYDIKNNALKIYKEIDQNVL